MHAWQSLRGLDALAGFDAESHGLRWLSLQEGAEYGKRLAERHREQMPIGTLWPGDTWAQSQVLTRNKLAILAGPRHGAAEGAEEGVWYVDPSDPSTVYYALSELSAPVLWHDVPTTPEAIAELATAVRDYAADEGDGSTSYPAHFRAVMGYVDELRVPDVYSGQLVEADPAALTNYWVMNPYRPSEGLELMMTTHSRSLVRCELHQTFSLYVWDMHYRPAPHARVLARVNEAFDVEAPLDLPLDVLGCVLGFRFDSDKQMLRYLGRAEDALAGARSEDEGAHTRGMVAYCVEGIGALRHEDPDLPGFLAHFETHPAHEVRLAVAGTYYGHAMRDEFEAMRARETHPELRKQLDQLDVPDEPKIVPHAFG